MTAVLTLSAAARRDIVGHMYAGLPDEACGLLIGDADTATVTTFHPTRNAAASAKLYSIAPLDFLDADDAASEAGLAIIGVVHSHTHTDAYPSPTDIAQAPDPSWHYVIVSLRDTEPMLRSYRIVDGTVDEEPVTVSA